MNRLKNLFLDILEKANKAVKGRRIISLQAKGLLTVGKGTYGIHNLDIHSYKGSEVKVSIGKYCSIGPKVTIITGGIHPVNWISTYPFRIKLDLPGKYKDGMPSSNGEILIGNDVWIGTDVLILSGVKIGNGSVIASGSIVTKDVGHYCIVAGNPAKVVKLRFEIEHIEKLLLIEWWNWDDKKIMENIDILSSNRIDKFVEEFSATK